MGGKDGRSYNHQRATCQQAEVRVTPHATGGWLVSVGGETAALVRAAECRYHTCYQRCGDCGICIHRYTYTCPEGLVIWHLHI